MSLNVALLVLRLSIGVIFAAHGAQKVFGWWDGPGIGGWRSSLAGFGFRPAGLFAWLSALTELVGGILLAVGLLTPLAAMMLIGLSVVIIIGAHQSKGFFSARGGFEYPLVLATSVVAILLAGPADLSFDAALGLAAAPEARVALFVIGLAGGFAALLAPRVLGGVGHSSASNAQHAS